MALCAISLLYLASFWISTASLTGGGSHIVGSEKPSAYECGFEPVGDARMKFEIIYYVIGILYLIFDLELIFLFPLAVMLRSTASL